MRQRKIWIAIVIIVFIALTSANIITNISTPSLAWTMINVNKRDTQKNGDAHLIEVRNGKTILIDAGSLSPAKENLIPFLQKNKISKLDLVFVTHAHENHYGGVSSLLDAGIKIKEIYFNLPKKSVCDSEIPWGCNYQEVLTYYKNLKAHNLNIKTAIAGQEFDLGKKAKLKILYAFDGINTPVGQTDINDTSLIMMLEQFGIKTLFTGDLNNSLGGYLAERSPEIAADLLKVPHHGAESAAPDSFLEKVKAKYAFVPGQKGTWCTERSARMRQLFKRINLPVFVNGFSGNIRVENYRGRIKIIEETPQKGNLC